MSDQERLDEAIDDVDEIYSYIKGDYFDEKWGLGEKAERVKGLLRAYRDLLANRERLMEVTEKNAPVLRDGRYLAPGHYIVTPTSEEER